MDRADLDAAEHLRALRGLARLNWLSRSDAILWPAIRGLAGARPDARLRVLDLASGSGDVPIALAKRALRLGLALDVAGCDKSEVAMRLARENAARENVSVSFATCDVLNEPIPSGHDVVTCSLFLHHLDESDACRFITQAASAARKLLLINDLVRSPAGYRLAWWASRLATRSAVVRHDGPVSVAAAFSLAEVRELAAAAGLDGAQLSRHWPERFLLSWSR